MRRELIDRPFTIEELEALPTKHEARRNPDLIVRRSYFTVQNPPKLSSIQNRIGFLFKGEKAILINGE